MSTEPPADWTAPALALPQPKQSISVRLDRDVLDFFKAQGSGYQTRINAVLRAYMAAKQAAPTQKENNP